MTAGRKEICLSCPNLKNIRGNFTCPKFRGDVMKEILNPNAICESWGNTSGYTKINFYKDKSNLLDINDLWLNQKVFLLCNGENRNKFDLDLLNQSGIMSMTMNNGGNSFKSTFWTGQDTPTKFVESIWLDPKVMKFVPLKHRNLRFSSIVSGQICECPNMIYHKRSSVSTLTDWFTSAEVNWNTTVECGANYRSSMLSAIHILYALGFRTIYILGADFIMSPEHKYCFDEDRSPKSINHNNAMYKASIVWFQKMESKLKELGLEIYNCDPESNLKVVPLCDYKEAISKCKIVPTIQTKGRY